MRRWTPSASKRSALARSIASPPRVGRGVTLISSGRPLVAGPCVAEPVETAPHARLVEREPVPASPLLHRAAERGGRVPAHHDGRPRPLHRLGMGLDVLEGHEAPAVGGPLLAPDRPHRGQVFVGHRAPRLERNAERPELGLEVSDAHAENQAAAGEDVERRELLGQDQRVALRDDDDARREPNRRRARRGPGERE